MQIKSIELYLFLLSSGNIKQMNFPILFFNKNSLVLLHSFATIGVHTYLIMCLLQNSIHFCRTPLTSSFHTDCKKIFKLCELSVILPIGFLL